MNLNFTGLGDLGGLIPVALLIWWVLVIIVHVAFAVGIFTDASAVARRRGFSTIVTPVIWALAALVTGALAVLVYWLMHHSTLNPHKPDSAIS
ncbi:MAG: hypothetical protein H7Y43_04800 [Akkermansiaceae bacterium]|nr:hypothetical protein [Verrucomicrobiales bacterium]